MRNSVQLLSLFLFGCLAYGVRGQMGVPVIDDAGFRKLTRSYAQENLSDATMVSLFTRFSDQGDPRATLWLARLHWGGRCDLKWNPGLGNDLADPVIDQVIKLAEGGDHEAQFLIGSCYHEGFALDRDFVEAVKWYFKAIEGQQLSVYGNLGILLAEGAGVEADIGQARKLFETGAGLGSSSCRNLLKVYAPPDPQSMARLQALRQNKVIAALGRKTEDAVRVLADSGVITAPDDFIDFPDGALSCLEFEDDGIILLSGGDGIVRCIDAYRGMTLSDKARGGIPLGIAWRDDPNTIKAKQGTPYNESRWNADVVWCYIYQAGNLQFTLTFKFQNDEGVETWRVREIWQEDL